MYGPAARRWLQVSVPHVHALTECPDMRAVCALPVCTLCVVGFRTVVLFRLWRLAIPALALNLVIHTPTPFAQCSICCGTRVWP